MQPVDISPILLIGLGFFIGTLFSILVLDQVYKKNMRSVIDKIYQYYCKGLDLQKKKVESEVTSCGNHGESPECDCSGLRTRRRGEHNIEAYSDRE